MTLYLKYRSKNLDELDSSEVRESLKKIVSSNSIPHAFLFTGPKGTGKTSAARILAKIINCEQRTVNSEPCDKCDQCLSITKGNNLDVIEMDAASHRGIDDVRTLRDAVKLAPTKAKKKIYIIDEAHMLTTEACNALLKTLEEPPEHVIFILATTNPEKLLDTIRSRTTVINFRKASIAEILESLKRIVDAEKIKISNDELLKIAASSDGSFRDAIKILEQFSLEGPGYLNKFQSSNLDSFINFLIDKDGGSAVNEVEKIISSGVSATDFAHDLLEQFHQVLIDKVKNDGLTKEDLIKLSDLFIEANKNLPNSPIEQLPIEIAVLKWCGINDKDPPGRRPSGPEAAPVEEIEIKEDLSMISLEGSAWQKILTEVRPINASVEGLLRSSKPLNYDGKALTLGVFYKFHKERLEDAHHRKILEDVVGRVLNTPTKIICTLVEPIAKMETVLTETKEPDIVKAAEEIFG